MPCRSIFTTATTRVGLRLKWTPVGYRHGPPFAMRRPTHGRSCLFHPATQRIAQAFPGSEELALPPAIAVPVESFNAAPPSIAATIRHPTNDTHDARVGSRLGKPRGEYRGASQPRDRSTLGHLSAVTRGLLGTCSVDEMLVHLGDDSASADPRTA